LSFHAVSWVLKNSKERLGNRLVLIVLADHAHADGTNAFPSVDTIKTESYMSERNVRYALRALEQSGAIYRTGVHDSGTHIYAIGGMQDLQGGQSSNSDMQDIAPKRLEQPAPSEERLGGMDSQEIVAHYVEHAESLGVVIPRQTKGATAQQIGKLVQEGIDSCWILRAVELLTEKGLNPSTLPSLVVEAQREGKRNGKNGLTAAQILALPVEETL
jgi:hypothetical protein